MTLAGITEQDPATSCCLCGHLPKPPGQDIVHLDRPQDKVLMIEAGTLTWL